MGKWIRRILFIFFLGVFLFSAASIASILWQYHKSDKSYAQAVERFVRMPEEGETAQPVDADEENGDLVLAPIVVDFDALREFNSDVEGWLYCEDTVINYPVLHGINNDMYLHHLYDKSYSIAGSLFVEAANAPNFQDANTIIYGHNMRNGSMFGTLDEWQSQEYYEAHPVFWLLTPNQDYRVEIMGGYTTSAYSDVYTIYSGYGEAFEKYLDRELAKSMIETTVEPEEGVHYVLLSTCAYVFDNARFVLHGKLIPVDSAGGVPKKQTTNTGDEEMQTQ